MGSPPMHKYRSFAEFYPFYLSEHSARTTRRLHFLGSTLGLVCVALVLVTSNGWWLLVGLAIGYGLAWFAHFVFEKNRPATVPPAALQLPGRLADVLGHPDRPYRFLAGRTLSSNGRCPASFALRARSGTPGSSSRTSSPARRPARSAPVSRLARKTVRQLSGSSMSSRLTCHSRCAPAASITKANGQPACSVKPAARIRVKATA